MTLKSWLRVACLLTAASAPALSIPARAADAPAEIKIGTLYAGSGQMASTSVPLHAALEWWADGLNKGGGVYVKAWDKKIPIKLVSYDDQSSPSLAANLTNQLITRDKVDILLSDSTSVMTASSVPVAKDHKMLLWDVTGSSPNFFSPDNQYIVLLALAATDRYPKTVADFVSQMPKLGIKSVALLYNTADYTAFQASAVRKAIQATPDLKLVFDRGVPANTTDYTLLVNNVDAAKPDALFEFGYPANEIAFLHALQDNDTKFKFMFTGYGLTEFPLMKTNGVSDVLMNTYALAGPASYEFKVNYGLNRDGFKEAFEHWIETKNLKGVEFGFNGLAGYQAGLVIERALAVATSLDQLELRRAVFTLSGTMNTLAGPFILAPDGSQSGEILPLAQIVAGAKGSSEPGLNVIWPADLATAKPIYPAP
ncbi:ABC transporter substrate-binding protein [Acidisphaera sp. L21]|uniref:ABC transporter substrate-binding protein n=1 Tax=Acidisphaera sp. L21 TaxID=1641851 RepID=UPI00131E5F7C|nr:ABC transporter substrate-binding protein [Acidisphaera sp. L21]